MTLITEPSISFDPFHLSNSLPLQSFIAHLTLTNKLSTKILNLWSVTLNACRQAWWIEILTAQPKCTYYFGPFVGAWEAEVASKGFVEDLEGEFAEGITIKIDRHFQPDLLTILHGRGYANEHDSIELGTPKNKIVPVLSIDYACPLSVD